MNTSFLVLLLHLFLRLAFAVLIPAAVTYVAVALISLDQPHFRLTPLAAFWLVVFDAALSIVLWRGLRFITDDNNSLGA